MIKNLERFPLPGPIRGFNDTDEESNIPANVLVDVLNFEFVRDGITTRSGFSAYSTSGLPSEYINLGHRFVLSSAVEDLFIVTRSGMYVESSTGVFSSLLTGLNYDYPAYAVTFMNMVIVGMESNVPRKFDGTTLRTLAITPPASAPTVAVGAAGSLTGNYQYKITFYSASGAETNPSPASIVVSPAAQQVALSDILLGSGEVASRKIYRTLAGGTLYYYLDTIGNNTATTYGDNIPDAQLSTDLVPSEFDSPPSGLKFLAVYKQYLFGVVSSEPTTLRHSYSSIPEIFFSGFELNVGKDDGQPIIGIVPMKDALYVFKTHSTWPIMGSTPDDFQVAPQPIHQSLGFYHRSVAFVDFGQGDVMVGFTGSSFSYFDGYQFRNVGVQRELGINVTGFIEGLDSDSFEWATGYNDREKYQYQCFVRRSGMGYNDRMFVWDYRYNSVSIFDLAGNTIFEWVGLKIFGSSSSGVLYKRGGFNDAGVAINQIAELPWWGIGGEFNVSFRFLFMNVVQWGTYSPTMNMYVDADSQATSLSLAGGMDWGSTAWTTDAGTYFITADIPVRNSSGVNYKGRYFKTRLSHAGINQPLTWLNATVLFERTRDMTRGTSVTNLGSMGVV